jgi:hypothetical protein
MTALVHVLLPLYDPGGRKFPPDAYADLRERLTDAFGGVTVHARAPVEGWWQPSPSAPAQRDDLVIFEVVAEAVDRAWWADLRRSLERRFRQQEILIRVHSIDLL